MFLPEGCCFYFSSSGLQSRAEPEFALPPLFAKVVVAGGNSLCFVELLFRCLGMGAGFWSRKFCDQSHCCGCRGGLCGFLDGRWFSLVLIISCLDRLFAGERAGRGTYIGWEGDFTLPTKSVGFYWHDSGLLVGTFGVRSTPPPVLLTKLCSAGRVLARDFEWGRGQRGFFMVETGSFRSFFSVWEIPCVPTAPYLPGDDAALIPWQHCESKRLSP